MSDTTSAPTIPPFLNRAMSFVLRSPVHGVVSKAIMLITFTGRKSGKTYTTPVSYSERNGEVVVFTHANWWQNLRGGAPVTMRIRGEEFQGLAEPVADDKESVAAGLSAHLRQVPSDAKYYDVTFAADGNPRADEVARAVQTVVMIRIRPC
jgi:deazaflavin-dependent oxidoreductase (nitroreductase family)